jgi:uncharacterized repeat protein (TIGR01451 family)
VPDLSVTLSGLTELPTATNETMTLTVANADQAPSTGAGTQATVTLPAGITLVSFPPACTYAAPTLTCPVGAMLAGEQKTFNFTINAPAPVNDVPITAQVDVVAGEINGANNSETMIVSAPGHPDLTVQSITGPGMLTGADPGTYVLTIGNTGNLDSNDGTVLITLPSDTQVVASSLSASPGITCTVVGPASLQCVLGPIAQGKTATVRFAIVANAGSEPFAGEPLKVAITGVTGESVTVNNTGQIIVAGTGVFPDLTSSITGPGTLAVGATGAYTVTVSNIGTDDSVGGDVEVLLPVGLEVIPASLPAGCIPAAGNVSFICTLGNIAKGASVTIPFSVTATQAFSNESIDVRVNNVPNEAVSRVLNNHSFITLDAVAGGMGGAQPVPALDTLALALLALLTAGGAAVGLRRRG